MKRTSLSIKHIPAVLWGEPASRVFVAVHGNQSNKADPVIQLLAQQATVRGYQVLSFDLPEHGDRREEGTPCKVQVCVAELSLIMEYAAQNWHGVSLFACSMGAYFSLLACRDLPLEQCLFLSPVVDMERIIQNMMTWFAVSPQRLEQEQEIATPIGQNLYWDYYCYVKAHPVERWQKDTAILYGELDDLCELAVVSGFAKRFRCQLQIVKQGEHYFHTPAQLGAYTDWLKQRIIERQTNDRSME